MVILLNRCLHKVLIIFTVSLAFILLIPNNTNSQNIRYGIDIDISFLWRDAQIVESTGVESTFIITADAVLYYYIDINDWFSIYTNLNIELNQPYSYKARYKKFFNPSPVNIRYACVEFILSRFNISVGNLYSPDNDLANEQIIPPIAVSVPDFSLFPDDDMIYYNVLSSKPRDVPIFYDSAPFNLFDTGLSITADLHPFYLSFYILNGEEGLDSNSDKYYVFEAYYELHNIFKCEISFSMGNMGSIPFKSYSDKLKLNIYFRVGRIRVDIVGSVFRMGLTHKNLNNFNSDLIKSLGFDGLPLEPYDIPNLHDIGKPLYAYGFFVQVRYDGDDLFFGRLNFSLMDSDYRYNDFEIYQIKFRIFGDFGLSLLDDDLRIRIGASYTYNPVFLLGDQLYHYWENIHGGEVHEGRLNYYLLYVIINYRFNIS